MKTIKLLFYLSADSVHIFKFVFCYNYAKLLIIFASFTVNFLNEFRNLIVRYLNDKNDIKGYKFNRILLVASLMLSSWKPQQQ